METTTSKQDMTRLLRRAQRFQANTRHCVSISTYYDHRGLWFALDVIADGKILSVGIYRFRSVEENAAVLYNLINNL